jgi:hypothetical protein
VGIISIDAICRQAWLRILDNPGRGKEIIERIVSDCIEFKRPHRYDSEVDIRRFTTKLLVIIENDEEDNLLL